MVESDAILFFEVADAVVLDKDGIKTRRTNDRDAAQWRETEMVLAVCRRERTR